MTRRTLFITVIFVIAGVLSIYFYYPVAERKTIFSCTTELTLVRNYGMESTVKVNVVSQFYFYNNKTGVTSYKGAAETQGKSTLVDRDVNYIWEEINSTNVIRLTYKDTMRRHNDNVPDEVWGDFARPGTSYYITLTEVAPTIWLIQDRKYPTYLCKER